MATRDDSEREVAPGVLRYDGPDFYYLQGRKDALVASGLVRPEWFPTLQERNKRGYVKRTRTVEHEGRRVECRQASTHKYLVYFSCTEEERTRREALKDFEEAQKSEDKEMRCLPSSHDEYRAETVERVERFVEHIITFFCGDSSMRWTGYSYAPEVLEEISLHFQEIRGLLETGRTVFDKQKQQARIAEIKSKTAAANPELRKFLGSLQLTK